MRSNVYVVGPKCDHDLKAQLNLFAFVLHHERTKYGANPFQMLDVVSKP